MRDFPESDWKLLRQLHLLALDRFCQRALSEIAQRASAVEPSAHAQYLAVFNLVNRRNSELAEAFDDLRRSTALRHLICIYSRQLLTEEEFSSFSAATRNVVEATLAAFANHGARSDSPASGGHS